MPMRQIHMDSMDTTMVNLASPAARRALGRVKDMGQKMMVNTEFQRSTWMAMAAVAGVRLNRGTSAGAAKNRQTQEAPIAR